MLQGYINLITDFVNNAVIPLLFALAFLFTAWNIFKFYIAGAAKDIKDRKSVIIYGVGAMVAILSFWGIINWISGTLEEDLGTNQTIIPDYIE